MLAQADFLGQRTQQHVAHGKEGVGALAMIERALRLDQHAVEQAYSVLAGGLDELPRGDIEAPRQVQLAAKIDREQHAVRIERHRHQAAPLGLVQRGDVTLGRVGNVDHRSEERRVGKEWRARWSLDKSKEKVERSTSEQSVW